MKGKAVVRGGTRVRGLDTRGKVKGRVGIKVELCGVALRLLSRRGVGQGSVRGSREREASGIGEMKGCDAVLRMKERVMIKVELYGVDF